MLDTLRLLWLLAKPSKRDAAMVYDLLSAKNALGEKSLYLNLGYWDGATTYDVACEALARVLAEAAGLKSGDEILDCGFGFGDQDLFWAEAFAPKRIVGLNITPVHVETAQRHVEERGLSGRIDLRLGSATEMPFEAPQFDKVLSLENAFHYVTREKFFHHAFRALRPGGRLAVADIIPLDGVERSWKDGVLDYFSRSFWQIPKENMYGAKAYGEKLAATGFENIRIRSIVDKVRPFSTFALKRLSEPDLARRMTPSIRALWTAAVRDGFGFGFDRMDYVIVVADKPALPEA